MCSPSFYTHFAEAKITYFQECKALVHHDILWFQVSVVYSLKFDSGHKTMKDVDVFCNMVFIVAALFVTAPKNLCIVQ